MGWDSVVQPHSMGGVRGGEEGHTHTHTHTGTHTGTYTRMLHLPFSDLPLKMCPKRQSENLVQAILQYPPFKKHYLLTTSLK